MLLPVKTGNVAMHWRCSPFPFQRATTADYLPLRFPRSYHTALYPVVDT